MLLVTVSNAWADLPADHSPFKVVCTAHSGTQLVERGGAHEEPDGFVTIRWKPRNGRVVPESDTTVRHADGSKTSAPGGIRRADGSGTYTRECPVCRQPKEVRHGHLVTLLRERWQAGQTDAAGRVVLDLADVGF